MKYATQMVCEGCGGMWAPTNPAVIPPHLRPWRFEDIGVASEVECLQRQAELTISVEDAEGWRDRLLSTLMQSLPHYRSLTLESPVKEDGDVTLRSVVTTDRGLSYHITLIANDHGGYCGVIANASDGRGNDLLDGDVTESTVTLALRDILDYQTASHVWGSSNNRGCCSDHDRWYNAHPYPDLVPAPPVSSSSDV